MKKKPEFKNRNSFLWKLLLIGLLPGFCIMLILSAIFFPMILKVADENDAAYEKVMLYAVSSQFANLCESVNNVQLKIESSDWLHDIYIDHHLNNKAIDSMEKYTILSDLGLWCSQENHLIFLSVQFYGEANELYSSKGVYSNLSYFQELAPDQFQYFFFDEQNGFSTVSVGGREYLLYCAPISDIKGGAAKGALNLIFDAEGIGKNLDLLTENTVCAFRLSDLDGNLRWCYSANPTAERTVMLSTESLSGDYLLELEIPWSVHTKTSSQIRPNMVIVILLSFALCIAFSLVLSAIGYRPIDAIIRKFAHDEPKIGNEFETLDLVINRILLEKLEAKAALDALKLLSRQNLLGGLLNGTSSFVASSIASNPSCDLTFPYPLLTVIACHVPFSKLPNLSSAGLPKSPELAMEVLAEHAQGSLAMNVYLYYEDTDHYRIIANYTSEPDLRSYLKRLSGECLQYFQSTSTVSRFGVGNSVQNSYELYRASDQASNALGFAIPSSAGCVVYFGQIASQVWSSYFYPFSTELLLSHTILDGNTGAAKTLLEDVIRTNAQQYPRNSFSALYTDLFSTVLRSAQSLGISLNNRFFGIDPPADLSEIQRQIEKLIDDTCFKIQARQAELAGCDIDQQILAYIEQNLFEADLSLSSIAETFHRSSAYISLLFKRSKNRNYSDYVNHARITRAIELMVNDQISFKDVYPMVGYASFFTFRRNFIKYTNQTPSDFALSQDASQFHEI